MPKVIFTHEAVRTFYKDEFFLNNANGVYGARPVEGEDWTVITRHRSLEIAEGAARSNQHCGYARCLKSGFVREIK